MTERLIRNTREPARHPWPDDILIQGGASGVVFRGNETYRTAFVEVFPSNPPTFLRGEGATIADAEDACWRRYEVYRDCSPHGPYERHAYRNGSGVCTKCGTWINNVLPPLPEPEKPAGKRSLLARVFADQDPEALATVLDAVARVDELPPAEATRRDA